MEIIGAFLLVLCIILNIFLFHYKNLSEKDVFTGCYNKDWTVSRKNSKIVRMMKSHKNSKKQLGILFIDMDNFKGLNDTKGHVFGDNILKMTVAATRKCLHKYDVLARFGGDEFLVLVPNTSHYHLSGVAEAILDNIMHTTKRTVSIGGAVFHDGMPVSVDALIRRADDELYKAKITKNCISMYDLTNEYQ